MEYIIGKMAPLVGNNNMQRHHIYNIWYTRLLPRDAHSPKSRGHEFGHVSHPVPEYDPARGRVSRESLCYKPLAWMQYGMELTSWQVFVHISLNNCPIFENLKTTRKLRTSSIIWTNQFLRIRGYDGVFVYTVWAWPSAFIWLLMRLLVLGPWSWGARLDSNPHLTIIMVNSIREKRETMHDTAKLALCV